MKATRLQQIKTQHSITILLFIFITFNCVGQNTYNFSVNDKDLIWQKVFDTDLSYNELVTTIENTGHFTDLSFVDSKITGNTKEIILDYKSLGYTRANITAAITIYKPIAFVLIEHKEGRYRVTLKNIEIVCQTNESIYTAGERESVSEIAIKKGEFRKSFLKSTAEIYNYNFDKYFTFEAQKVDDNW